MSTNHQETSTLPIEPLGYERQNEEAFDVLRVLAQLWRWRYFVAAFSVVGAVVAGLVAISMDNRYTAEVVVQSKFPRQQPSGIYLDASSVIQTDASLIQSREIAEGVVDRLGLAKDPNFAEHSSLLNRAFALITFWHSRSSLPVSLRENVADRLRGNLEVRNDPKSLSLRISYTSTGPEQSARIANAFAEEYLRVREEKAAKQHLAELAVLYGPKHPNVLKAKSQLDASRAPSVVDRTQILAGAFPPVQPSGPPRGRIVAVAFIGSLLAGIALVLILERANTSFRSDAELATEVKAPCLGMFAEGSAGPSVETARAIATAAGLGAQSPQSKILLVTCSVPEEGEFLVSTAIARSLVQIGKRALVLDLSGKAPPAPNSHSLKRVLNAVEHHPLKLANKLTVLRSALAMPGNQSPVTSPSFPRLLEQAREQCDLVIIGTPPVMISADTLYLGRHADFVLHVVRWNSTPRHVVLAALDRLRNFGIPIDGVILSRVHPRELRTLMGCSQGWKDWKSFGCRMKSAPTVVS
jgi:Mrp family chromosome partitioning ATPase